MKTETQETRENGREVGEKGNETQVRDQIGRFVSQVRTRLDKLENDDRYFIAGGGGNFSTRQISSPTEPGISYNGWDGQVGVVKEGASQPNYLIKRTGPGFPGIGDRLRDSLPDSRDDYEFGDRVTYGWRFYSLLPSLPNNLSEEHPLNLDDVPECGAETWLNFEDDVEGSRRRVFFEVLFRNDSVRSITVNCDPKGGIRNYESAEEVYISRETGAIVPRREMIEGDVEVLRVGDTTEDALNKAFARYEIQESEGERRLEIK